MTRVTLKVIFNVLVHTPPNISLLKLLLGGNELDHEVSQTKPKQQPRNNIMNSYQIQEKIESTLKCLEPVIAHVEMVETVDCLTYEAILTNNSNNDVIIKYFSEDYCQAKIICKYGAKMKLTSKTLKNNNH